MAFFSKQLSNVIQWEEFREDMIFYKWHNNEIKKGSKLIIRPGQDAIFMQNGKIEGIFEDEGEYDIETQITPFLSTLKGFRFGFQTGMKAEVLFVNTKEFIDNWGTMGPVNIPSPQLPGGMPIRANGTFKFKVVDYVKLIDTIVGVRNTYLVEDIRNRISSVINQLLMKWITKEGKDMFNLQANSFDISKGIQKDLDMELFDSGLSATGFNVVSFNYPKEVQNMITKSASHSMVGDVNKYQQVEMTDGIASGKVKGGGVASDMTGMMMGMNVANQMMNNMNQQQNNQQQGNQQQASNQTTPGEKPNFCPNCGSKTTDANFCPNCGQKLA